MVNDVQERTTSAAAADYLSRPYTRTIVPQEDGTFHAEIIELPGCIATGSSAAEAYSELEEVAESWLSAALSANQAIPPALEANDFSGKIVLRMPRSLHRKASLTAERDGVSLNQFMVTCIAECVGASLHKGRMPGVLTFNNFNIVNALTVSSAAGFHAATVTAQTTRRLEVQR